MRFVFGIIVGIVAIIWIVVATLNTRQHRSLGDTATMAGPVSVSDLLNRNR